MNIQKLALIIGTATRNMELIASIAAKALQITRASLAPNPVQLFNPTVSNLPSTFGNNVEVIHGDWGFIGGDTITVEIDGSTKVANSVVECPVKIYRTKMSTLQPPTNITGNESTGFSEQTGQSYLDQVKTQDGIPYVYSSSATNAIAQIMLEIDISSLANSLNSGSNASLKASLKSFIADIWSMASGSNGGVTGYACIFRYWNGSSWSSGVDSGNPFNSTSTISKISTTITTLATMQARVDSNNKIYILVASQYASDGVIASSVSLDYFKLTLGLNRNVDTVTPSTVNLPKNWMALVKFSPMWDSTRADRALEILQLENTDSNKYELFFQNGRFYFGKNINGSWQSIYTSAQTFSKGTIHSIAIAMAKDGMYLLVLKNNGTMEKVFIGYTTRYVGAVNVRCLHGLTGNQGDGFSDQFALYDLDAMGGMPTDAVMTNILQGVSPNPLGVTMSELFDINQVSLHANAIRNGDTITLNASGAWQNSTITIPVLPNNQYEFKCTTNGTLRIDQYCNSVLRTVDEYQASSRVFTTSNITNYLIIRFENSSAGTFTFSNISLKLKM